MIPGGGATGGTLAVNPDACAAGVCCAEGTEASFSFRLIVLFTSFKDLNRSIVRYRVTDGY